MFDLEIVLTWRFRSSFLDEAQKKLFCLSAQSSQDLLIIEMLLTAAALINSQ